MAFHTAYMPRPQSANRPPMPVVPRSRVRPEPPKKPEPPKSVMPIPSTEDILAMFREVPIRSATGQEVSAVFSGRRARARVEAVAAKHGFTFEELISQRRRGPLVVARYEAIAAVYKEFPTWSLPRIGRFFDRDHTSILYSLKKSGVWKESDTPAAVAQRAKRAAK